MLYYEYQHILFYYSFSISPLISFVCFSGPSHSLYIPLFLSSTLQSPAGMCSLAVA